MEKGTKKILIWSAVIAGLGTAIFFGVKYFRDKAEGGSAGGSAGTLADETEEKTAETTQSTPRPTNATAVTSSGAPVGGGIPVPFPTGGGRPNTSMSV